MHAPWTHASLLKSIHLCRISAIDALAAFATCLSLPRLQVQALKAELELKTKVLLMPVDACVKHALHGNTVRNRVCMQLSADCA